LSIGRALVEEMYAHARAASPEECCGLVGGGDGVAQTVYRLRNVAGSPTVAYEAAPEDLFAAQREMRARGETLVGIYHSHPRSCEPEPSRTDVRLAFYPSAIYFIIGLDGAGEGVLRAFRISEREGVWERVSFRVIED
jgi:proteasome lid subunit RPN8/RPN11